MKICDLPRFAYRSAAALALFSLAACGGGGGGGGGTPAASSPPPATTASGVFKDTTVEGLAYASGSQSGTTGTNGGFTYQIGQPVTFSVGGVTVGSATGQPVITPVDLVSGSNSSTLEVQNIVRFLLMLDTDGDPANGIAISSAVQGISANWAQVDFTVADLANELVTIISDAASVDGTLHALPDATGAQSHLESTLRCERAGGYRGSFAGDDSGRVAVVVDPATGLVSGFGFSNGDQALFTLIGTTAIGFDQDAAFVSGDVSTGATFSGQFSGPDDIDGTWELPPESGTFSVTRFGGAADAVFRFAANFSGDHVGYLTFDVDAQDNVTGVGHDVEANEGFSITSGTVSDTTLAATYNDSTTVAGTLDTASGAVSGTWDYPPSSLTGDFAGTGCKLN